MRIVAFSLVVCVAAYIWLRPASAYFIDYLWWRVTAAHPTHGSVRSGEVRIHYTRYGKGPTVMLLHGGLSNRLSWFSQIPWLVRSGRQVILVDTRGHGRSGIGSAELSYRQFADDAARVLDQLDVAHTDVIGWSDGGNTALLLGRYFPERIGRIVTISANYDPAGLMPEAYADTHNTSSGVTYWLRRWWTQAGARTTELEHRIKRLWRAAPILTDDDLRAIQSPSLIIAGRSDVVSIDHAEEMAEQMPHAMLLILAGGHALPVTHPDEINRAIENFLYKRALAG